MPVFQCNSDVHLFYSYDRYNFKKGQLMVVNDPKLVDYLDKHINFVEVRDAALLKLAPPLHMIKQPEDPYRMRKEDMITELRSYGIKVDPYSFCEKLTMQLTLARKMLKRNFITVLNAQGFPVYIDSVNLPTPILNEQDEDLPEPEDATGEFYQAEKPIQQVAKIVEVKKEEEEKMRIRQEMDREREMKRKVAMSIEPVIDENEIDNGKHYEQWLAELAERNEYKAPIEIEIPMQKIDMEPKITEEVSKKDDFNFETIEQFKYLIETQDRRFMLNEITEEDKANMAEVKWSKISIDVAENFLRYYGIFVTYEDSDQSKRWDVISSAKDFYDKADEKDKIKLAYEVNALTKRYEELTKYEPSYRDNTLFFIKRRITELGKYGVNVSYNNDTNLKQYSKKVYQLAKLGLQAPDTDEEINEKLRAHNRGSIIK